jgi:hypothetical protein
MVEFLTLGTYFPPDLRQTSRQTTKVFTSLRQSSVQICAFRARNFCGDLIDVREVSSLNSVDTFYLFGPPSSVSNINGNVLLLKRIECFGARKSSMISASTGESDSRSKSSIVIFTAKLANATYQQR